VLNSVPAATPVSATVQSQVPAALAIAASPLSLAHIQQSDLSLKESMHWLALENWLHHCQTTVPTANSWVDVKGLIEASYHSRALQRWDLAYQLLCWPVGDRERPLHEQLSDWGHHRILIELWTPLLDQLDTTVNLVCLNELGHAHRQLGEFTTADTYHQRQLAIAQGGHNDYEVMRAWGGLGHLQATQHRFRSAIPYFAHQRLLAASCQATTYQIDALIITGRMQTISFRHQHRGFAHLNAALTLAQTHQDLILEARILSSLGDCHGYLGNHTKALPYLQRAVAATGFNGLKASDRILTLNALGFTYAHLGDTAGAVKTLQAALELARSCDLLRLELAVLHDLSLIESQFKGDFKAGVEFAQQALNLAQRFGNAYLILRMNASLAIYYAMQTEQALADRHFQAVRRAYPEWAHEIQPSEKVHILACIAQVKWLRGQRLSALLVVTYSLLLQPPWSSVNGRLVFKGAIATVFIRPTQKVLAWLQQQAKDRFRRP